MPLPTIAVRLAMPQKSDNVMINKCQIFQVEYDAVAGFRVEQRFQIVQVFIVQSTAQPKDHLSVREPRDLQHPPRTLDNR